MCGCYGNLFSFANDFQSFGIDHSSAGIANIQSGFPILGGWFDFASVLIARKKSVAAWCVSTQTYPRITILRLTCNWFFLHSNHASAIPAGRELVQFADVWCDFSAL